ncbi:MAG: hypothetical protein ACE5FD_12460 [Anaerolineae bacterium]
MVNGIQPTAERVPWLFTAADDNAIPQLAENLRQGRLVAFPTDTVYGV